MLEPLLTAASRMDLTRVTSLPLSLQKVPLTSVRFLWKTPPSFAVPSVVIGRLASQIYGVRAAGSISTYRFLRDEIFVSLGIHMGDSMELTVGSGNESC